MRQIVTLPAEHAHLFADHLLTLGIETKLDRDAAGMTVWVCNEDHLPRAAAELEAFRRDPGDARYAQARRQAAAIRRSEDRAEDDYRLRNERFRDRMGAVGRPTQVVLTFLLIAGCVLAFTAKRSDRADDPVYRALRVDSGEKVQYELGQSPRGRMVLVPDRLLPDVRAGEAWRLLTPALLHFGLGHLLMNMMSLYYLGGAVESRLGPARMLLLVLALAAFSNLGEYLLGRGVATADGRTVLVTSIYFGGMSGVLYGLFGYVVYKSRYRPEAGLHVPPSVVTIGLVWFGLCWLGALGPIANVAHTAGLLGGVALAALPEPRVGQGQRGLA